jgi:hypothetical protein
MPELKLSDRRRRATARGGIAIFYCALLVLGAVGLGYAQAGRRVAKPKSDPPVPKSAEAAAPVKEPTPEPEKISLLVVGSPSRGMHNRLGMVENLPGIVGRRLQDSRSLQVASGGEMTRGEANKRAKEKETKTFVVWMELQGHGFDIDPMNRRTRLEDLSVSYIVLEPGTGKIRSQGTVHLRSVNSGILGGTRRLPSCYPQPFSNFEFSLAIAGIETAERILRSFSLPNPPLCA